MFLLEYLREFLKHSHNLRFLAKLRKTRLQRLLKSPPNLLALPKTEPSTRKVTRSRARVDPTASQVSRAVPGAGPRGGFAWRTAAGASRRSGKSTRRPSRRGRAARIPTGQATPASWPSKSKKKKAAAASSTNQATRRQRQRRNPGRSCSRPAPRSCTEDGGVRRLVRQVPLSAARATERTMPRRAAVAMPRRRISRAPAVAPPVKPVSPRRTPPLPKRRILRGALAAAKA